jgi:hypothetical protein
MTSSFEKSSWGARLRELESSEASCDKRDSHCEVLAGKKATQNYRVLEDTIAASRAVESLLRVEWEVEVLGILQGEGKSSLSLDPNEFKLPPLSQFQSFA